MIPISTLYRRAGYKAPPWRIVPLLLVCFCLSTQLAAQVQGGQFHLGGQFSFDNYHSSGQNSFSTTIQPELGVMLSPKWSTGLSLPFTYNSARSSQSRYILGLAPFVRRYFDLKTGFYAIAHLQAGAQFSLNSKQVRWDIQAIPAICYFFSPRFALEAGFGGLTYFRNQSNYNGQEYFNSNSVLAFRASPVFSLRYYLPTQKPN